MAHHANIVREKARDILGVSINYGQLAHPERRSIIENLFNQVAHKVLHRIPSTTGSSPSDGRADQPEEMAEKYKIYVDEAEQVLDVWCAAYNTTPKSGSNFSKSPAEILADYYNNKACCLFPCIHSSSLSHLLLESRMRECKVRGSFQSGVAPYIQLDKARYTSKLLASSPELFGSGPRRKNDMSYTTTTKSLAACP
jgi:hypothetical protein